MKAIQVSTPGGPEALEYVDVPTPEPGDGEVLVRVEAVGVNYIDVYHRTGQYPMPLPFVPGSEAAGVVESTGERVGWAMVPGSCAEYARVPAERLVPLPDGIDTRTAAASLLQGMTGHYLVTSTFRIEPGHVAVVHAAAGGAGGWVVQLAKQRGAHVVATAAASKHDEVRELGADEVFEYDDPEWTRRSANVRPEHGRDRHTRHGRAVRPVERTGRSLQPRPARREERVPHPPDARALWRRARGVALAVS
jgi:NADPH2:quinone reductase